MKKIIISLIFLISTSSFAVTGDGSDGISILKLEASKVEALISKDGTYARLDDLREGFEHFDGAYVDSKNVLLNLKSPNLNVDSIVLQNGTEISAKAVMMEGGDMGGGGKVMR